jgi:hypothetical protein
MQDSYHDPDWKSLRIHNPAFLIVSIFASPAAGAFQKQTLYLVLMPQHNFFLYQASETRMALDGVKWPAVSVFFYNFIVFIIYY